MGAGFSRLNSLTIIQTSQGLAEYLLKEESEASKSGIVVGYDARHNSRKFAVLAAAVFTAKGIRVWWYEDLVHTPMVPFGVQSLRAAAGIMITASHNPAQDNGYKVYGSNGCQINSPADTRIAEAILQNLEPRVWGTQDHSPHKIAVLASMKAKYIEIATQKVGKFLESPRKPLRFVYTPMHGVGLDYLTALLEEIKISEWMTVVEQQASPNPDFPTVKYPNPEEKGALDLAIVTADQNGARFIIANDPDADRFAAAEKTNKGWHQFTGDEVGILLAYYLFRSKSSAFTSYDFMLASAVSSQILSYVASEEGFGFKETLTGFKWLGNATLDLRNENKRVQFAYEEALGYMIPDIVLDKDGITAAILFLSACVEWGSPFAMLQRLYEKYGYFETTNTYWRSPDVATTIKIFDQVRSLGKPYPASVGNRKTVRWRDLTRAFDSATADRVPLLPCSTNSQMITCWLSATSDDHGVRFTIRASGTEPKIKSEFLVQTLRSHFPLIMLFLVYMECRGSSCESAKNGALQVLKSIDRTWFNDSRLTIDEKYSHLCLAKE